MRKQIRGSRPLALVAVVSGVLVAWSSAAWAQVCPDFLDAFPVSAVHFELVTSPAVLHHLPGPTAADPGDGWIGTADDGLAASQTIFGAPNDLGRAGSGLPGSPGTLPLQGTTWMDSDESATSVTGAGTLSLARPGEGAYSYLRARMGNGLETLSFLGGGISGVGKEQRTQLPLFVVQATLAGTPLLVPGVLFGGPFHADLISTSPGNDRRFDTSDDTGETVARGCNGLAPHVDGIANWFPLSFGAFPVTARPRITDRGEWDVRSAKERQPEGRTFRAKADLLFKVPNAQIFFAVRELSVAGYGFPRGEAEALLNPNFHPDGNLPDIPGFPGSGKGLARYIQDVVVPIAQARGAVFVGVLRGRTTTEIVGVPVTLELTLVATGDLGSFDLCVLDVPACD